MKLILLLVISVFWAMNMGASGLAVSFAPSVGSGVIKRKRAVIFFTIFVLLGSLLVGGRVAKTLSSKIIPQALITEPVVLIILLSAGVALFLANRIKIPQSTSIIIVGAFTGAGIYFRSLNVSMLLYLVSIWIGVSLLSYVFTHFLIAKIYPPRHGNLRFYEKFFSHENKLKKWTLLTDYYSAFGIGTNNVANVVGPLIAANLISPNLGFLFFSLIFGLGSIVFGKGVLNTVSKEIVPLGPVSASIVSLVVSTFIIVCSLLGLPAPYVQFSSLSILAVHTVKEEKNHIQTLQHPITVKILKVWLLTPIFSAAASYLLLFIFQIKR